jgi:hypothetical protein
MSRSYARYAVSRSASAADAMFLVYHDNHGFGTVRAKLASDICDWLLRGRAE